jgi:uncharacterized repeat protein (TIGR01451 family)
MRHTKDRSGGRGQITKALLGVIAVALMVAALPHAASADPATDPPSWDGSIGGRIVGEHGEPIVAATVTAKDGDVEVSVQTDEDGAYRLTELPPGSYLLWASGDPYLDRYYGGTDDPDQAQLVIVAENAAVSGIDIVLPLPTGAISGVVTDADGDPVEGVYVAAYGTTGYDSYHAVTDASGAYTFDTVRIGTYHLQFEADGFAHQYHGSVRSADESTVVEVTPGSHQTDVDATMRIGGSISGLVVDDEGDPVDDVEVEISIGDWTTVVDTDETGRYVVDHLLPGSFLVTFQAQGFLTQYYDGVSNEDEATLVAVGDEEESTNIDAALDRGASISGTLTDADGNGIDRGWATAEGPVWTEVRTRSDGTYTLSGLTPGEYVVSFTGRGSLPEYFDDVTDVEDATPVSVEADGSVTGIDASLSRGATISGTVTDEDGLPVAGVRVDADGPTWSWTTSGPDGRYTVSGLVAGEYRLTFQSDWHLMEIYDDATDWGEATPITVEDHGSVTGIDVVMAAGASISGTVRDDAGNPVEDASIEISGPRSASTRSGADGTYAAGGLPPGEYIVSFEYPDGEQVFYDGGTGWDDATPIVITGTETVTGINAGRTPVPGSLSGRITDEDGNPLHGAFAAVLDTSDDVQIAMTDEDGYWTIADLPADTYYVAYWMEVYQGEYWEDAIEFEDATPVELGADGYVIGLDASLEHLGSVVRGVITDADLWGLDEATVTFVPAGTDGPVMATATADFNGDYMVAGLPAGSYDVIAIADGYQTTTRSVPVEVVDGQLTDGADVVLPAASDLVLHAYAPGGGVRVGEEFTYSLAVGSVAPSQTGPVTLTDTVADGFELVSAKRGWFGVPCATNGATFTCALSGAPSTSSFVIVTVRATTVGTFTLNDASVTSGRPDRDPASNRASINVTVVEGGAPVDLAITSSAPSSAVHIGETFSQTYTVTNLGSTVATNVRVSGEVPIGFDLVRATQGWFSVPCTVVVREFSCAVPTTATSSFVTLTIEASTAGTYSSEATVTADQVDADPASNAAGSSVTVNAGLPAPDAALTLTGPTTVQVGETFTLAVNLSNRGSGAATDVGVHLSVPPGFELISSKRGWFGLPCAVAFQDTTCSIGSLGPDTFVLVTVRATTAGTFSPAAGITSAVDTDPGNNAASIDILAVA